MVIRSGPTFETVATNDLWDLENPPKPETYVEYSGPSKHGHGKSGAGASQGGDRIQRFVARILAGDKNENGWIEKDELPKDFQSAMSRLDKNGDARLDKDEIRLMAEEFRRRRAGSRESSRDPIVYGVAASDGRFVLRTGTRLYCVGETEEKGE